MSRPGKRHVWTPRSRFNQATNTPRKDAPSGGRKTVEFIPIILAKKMSPFSVPEDTVNPSVSRNTTKATPATANMRRRRR